MCHLLYVSSYIERNRLAVSLDYAILGFLSEHPRSGYDLKVRCFDGDTRLFWSADQAQIYRTLERLHASRLIAKTRRRTPGRPDRFVYDITEAGRHSLDSWLVSAAELPPVRDPFALQLYFGASLSDPVLAQLLVSRRAQHQRRLDELRHQADQLAAQTTMSTRTMVLRQTSFDGEMARERTTIDWLDDCIDAIASGALPHELGETVREHLSEA